MANKRDLKHAINGVCNDLFAECVATVHYGNKSNSENIGAILISIVTINNEYIRRVSHPEPGMKAKTYFKDLISNFNKQALEILDQIGSFN
ncbi:MAG: hypothetical protein ACI3YB_03140 [Prevotella sp.]